MHITQGPQFNGKASKRLHVMAKPIGAACNIDCTYCYYLSKQDLLEYKQGCSPIMDDETLESYIRQCIEGQNTPEIIFSWQGGEPTMLGLDYFKRIVELHNLIDQKNEQVLLEKKEFKSAKRVKYVKRDAVKKIIAAWIITVPAAAILSASVFFMIKGIML